MKKMIFRLLAFAIDLLFIYLVTLGFSFITKINPNKSIVSSLYNQLNEINIEYQELSNKIDNILEDNILSFDEYITIRDNYSYFKDIIKDVDVDSNLDEGVSKSIKDNFIKLYKDYNDSYNYKINYNNTRINIITIVVIILYLGVFEWYMHGKTIGKLIFRLKTVDATNSNINIPIWKYLIKSILVGEVIFEIIKVISVSSLSYESYLKLNKIIYNIQYIYEVLFMIVMFIRDDERSIHDLILNTRIALYDSKGKEIESKIFNDKEVINKTN